MSAGLATGLSVPAARRRVSPRICQLVAEWRRHNSLIIKSTNEIVYLQEFRLQRQANGCLLLTGFDHLPPGCQAANIDLEDWLHWLLQVGMAKVKLLVLEEIKTLTGRDYLDLRDLDGMAELCNRALDELLGINNGWVTLTWLVEQLNNFLDPEVLAPTQRARDTITSLATYNLIAANRSLWQSLEAQAPGLMPLIGFACRKQIIQFDDNVLRMLKQYGKQHGLTEAGWKMLCRFSAEHIRILLGYPLPECFRLASHYGEIGFVPPIPLMRAHLGYCQVRDVPCGTIPTWFDAAAIKEWQQQKVPDDLFALSFIRDEYHLAVDWLFHYLANGGTPDALQKRAGWKWIERQSEAWHAIWLEEQARQQTAVNYTWRSAIDTYLDGDHEVIPLLSSIDLAVEGSKMHHCVATYDAYCHEGRSRIFSIRREGKRVATAELVFNGRSWHLNQNRGPCNRPPGQEIMAVARRLQDRYNAATKKP
jgi:hypothetical protein